VLLEIAVQVIEGAIDQFRYIQSVKVLVCKERQYGLQDLERHLLILKRYNGLDVVRPEDASFPMDEVGLFDCLREPQRAFHCKGWEAQPYEVIGLNGRVMPRHCNQHGRRSSAEIIVSA
jgi:hypothetical protein